MAAAELIDAIGADRWKARLGELRATAGGSDRVARALARKHAIEVALERLRGRAAATAGERAVAAHAAEAARLLKALPAAGRKRLRGMIEAGLSGEGTLTPLFHLLATAARERARGFDVTHAGLAEGAPFDLLIRKGKAEAEIACETISAEDGRDVHRAAWLRLVEAVDPDLQTWLAAHPGRYLFKLTLTAGLKGDEATLAGLHGRIRGMLTSARRTEQDEAAILRLDPLMLAAAQADEAGLMPRLRREFGHEAHLAVMSGGGGVCVMAARAGRADEVAAAIGRRMAALAPARLSGTRPGILAMLVEDTDPLEWRHLREALEIEAAARQFLTEPPARHVVAVTCHARDELLADVAPLRYRSPGHPAAGSAELAAAITSVA